MVKFSVKKPLTVFVAVLAVLVLGVVAYLKMTPDLLPNMDFPYVVIVTTDPGASPEAVESAVTRPMEQSMSTLDRIKSVTSTSQDSVSMVVLEFEDGVNMDTVSVDIQQKINILQGSWDDGIGTPYVLKINPSMLPVQVAAVSYSGKDVTELSDFVENTLTQKLEGISGVASVTVSGTVQRQAHIILSQEKLDALTATLREAIGKTLDETASQLEGTRSQLESAKGAIRSTEESAVREAAMQALTAVQQSLTTLRSSESRLEANLKELAEIQALKVQLDAKNAVYQARMEAIRQDDSLTEEEKAEQLAAIENDPEYIRLQADLAELELRIAALNTSWEQAAEDAKRWRETLEQLKEQIRRLEDDSEVASIADEVTSGVITMADGVTQLLSANVQLDSALTQLEQGLRTLESSRASALEQADLSGALNIQTITALLTAQNFSMPAGYLQEDGVNYMVSVGDSISSRQELSDMVLFDLGLEGVEPVKLSDVAEIVVTDNSDEIYAKLNGDNGVIVSFNKQSTYATAEVSDNIQARCDTLEKEYDSLHFVPLMDQGDYIYIIINSILSSLGWGALFAVLILYLFLKDLRPTLITLCSIPVSVIFAVVLMYFSGVTINMISLSGLAVAVGMLVDNSVVVIENIYRLRSKGATVIQAAVSGAAQVVGAITASTLTTVCVFLPIVFVEGITKQLFTDLALTMTYSLLASLIVALTLVPAMASGMLKKEKAVKAGLLERVYPAYRRAVGWSLGHKAVVLLLAVVLLAGSAWGAVSRGFAFMPQIDMNNVSLTVTMPEGISREEAVALADEVVRRAGTVENVDAVGAMMSSGSGMDMSSMMGGSGGAYDVTAYVTMPEGASGAKAGKAIEELCADLPCQVTASGSMDSMSTYLAGSGVSLKVYGDDMEDLQSSAKALAATLKTVEGTGEVSDGLEEATTALHISVDRNAAMEKGVTVAQVYMAVASALTNTSTSSGLTLDGLEMEVSVQSPEESRMTREKLMDLEITPSSGTNLDSMSHISGMSGSTSSMGGMSALAGGSTSSGSSALTDAAGQEVSSFRLGDVAAIEETVSLGSIQREQQRRCVTVTAEVAEGYNVTKVTAAAQTAVAGVDLPQGITARFSGENEAIMDAMGQLLLMLGLGVLLVYLVMVAQFQSLRSPLIVMFTIPLAFTGGFLALLISGIELSVVSLIGFVMLVGVIVNNGIVLVDYINQLRLSGMERRETIVEAGVTRLRPILMTSMTTILGLVVMAFGGDAGTALMQPVALVCIGGLLYATLMTLLVVPSMYDLLSRRELRKVEVNLAQLPRVMDQSGAELNALASRLDAEQQTRQRPTVHPRRRRRHHRQRIEHRTGLQHRQLERMDRPRIRDFRGHRRNADLHRFDDRGQQPLVHRPLPADPRHREARRLRTRAHDRPRIARIHHRRRRQAGESDGQRRMERPQRSRLAIVRARRRRCGDLDGDDHRRTQPDRSRTPRDGRIPHRRRGDRNARRDAERRGDPIRPVARRPHADRRIGHGADLRVGRTRRSDAQIPDGAVYRQGGRTRPAVAGIHAGCEIPDPDLHFRRPRTLDDLPAGRADDQHDRRCGGFALRLPRKPHDRHADRHAGRTGFDAFRPAEMVRRPYVQGLRPAPGERRRHGRSRCRSEHPDQCQHGRFVRCLQHPQRCLPGRPRGERLVRTSRLRISGLHQTGEC